MRFMRDRLVSQLEIARGLIKRDEAMKKRLIAKIREMQGEIEQLKAKLEPPAKQEDAFNDRYSSMAGSSSVCKEDSSSNEAESCENEAKHKNLRHYIEIGDLG